MATKILVKINSWIRRNKPRVAQIASVLLIRVCFGLVSYIGVEIISDTGLKKRSPHPPLAERMIP
mgnify:CR=1 FL=1